MNSRIIVVTGASSGIGNVLANELSKNNTVIGLSRSVSKSYGDFKKIDVDLSLESEVVSVIKQIYETYGRIDVLVNNAGAGIIKKLVDSSLEDWNSMFLINATTTFLVSREVMRNKLRDDFLHIVNVSSEAGKSGFATYSAYCAAKFALTGLSEALKHELSQENVKVDIVYPGDVLTPFMEKCPIDSQLMAKYDINVLDEKYMLRAKDVTQSIRYLLDLPKNVTLKDGLTVLPVDSFK